MKNFKHLMTFESYSILGRVETVIITNEQGETVTCKAKIDTGSYSSRISSDIAKKLRLPVVDKKKIKSSMGEEDRTFVELQFKIAGIEIKTIAGIADMEGLRNEVAIGRKDIGMVDGIVDIKKKDEKPIAIPLNKPVEVELEVTPTEEQIPIEEIKESIDTHYPQITIDKDEKDNRSSKKQLKTYSVDYLFELNGEIKEISGRLIPYNTGRVEEYEFEPGYFDDPDVEDYYTENWEKIEEEILDKFYTR